MKNEMIFALIAILTAAVVLGLLGVISPLFGLIIAVLCIAFVVAENKATLALALCFLVASPALGQRSFINGVAHQGQEITCDLPEKLHIRNIGSHKDGAGMCVMSSIEMAARYHGLDELRGLRDWCAHEAGGAGPDKVNDQLRRFFKAKKLDPKRFQYAQCEPRTAAELEAILKMLDSTGRMICITYGYGPRYGSRISHMVCCAGFPAKGKWGVVLDNNFVGESAYEWVEHSELMRRIRMDGAWVFFWCPQPAPPLPHNLKSRR